MIEPAGLNLTPVEGSGGLQDCSMNISGFRSNRSSTIVLRTHPWIDSVHTYSNLDPSIYCTLWGVSIDGVVLYNQSSV